MMRVTGDGVQPDLLITRDFPPLGGGIARWMGEIAKRYPPGSLIVSTGEVAGSQTSDRLFPNRIDRIPFPATRLKILPGRALWSHRIVKLIDETTPRFLWCGTLRPAAYPARWAYKRRGLPYGIIFHGGDLLTLQRNYRASRFKRLAARALVGAAAVLVANSVWTQRLVQDVLRELRVPFDAARVHVVPLGTDPVMFRPGIDPTPVMHRYGLPPGRWLLTVARLVPHKGIDTTIRALALLKRAFPGLRYAIVGTGSQQAMLHTLVRECGLTDAVWFLPAIADAELPALYNLAEIYVGVSRQTARAAEGFGIAFLEAAACAKPVVAGRSGGIPDAVREDETGLLVESESPEAVADALCALLKAPNRGRALGEAGRRAVETFFNWDRVTADLRSLSHAAYEAPEAQGKHPRHNT